MRTASIQRDTNETKIKLDLNLDPPESGNYKHDTGVGFFDHMLDHVARHGRLAHVVEGMFRVVHRQVEIEIRVVIEVGRGQRKSVVSAA